MDPDLQRWESIGRTPIGADAPAGSAARYDPDFERLEGQVKKLEGVAGEAVDWPAVVALARNLLERKSKDLLVACYLALGLFQTDGYRGLARGLACIEAMVQAFWPSLFPELKRMRARTNALTWLSERGGALAAQRAPGGDESEFVAACDEALARLLSALGSLAGADAPGLPDLRRALKERVSQAAAPAPPGAGAPVPATAPAAAAPPRLEERSVPAPAPAPPPAGTIESREDCQRATREGSAALRRAAAFLRRQAPTQPAAYRLVRAVTWFELDALPPNEGGTTRIPSPPSHVRARCEALRSQAAWTDLLAETEARVSEFPLWLDLQRLAAEALGGLGEAYARALDAVKAELAALVGRLPAIADLQFADGVPFADEATRAFLGTVASRPTAAASAPAAPAPLPSDAGGALDELLAESRRLLGERQADDALARLQDAARRSPDGRTRFLIQFEIGRACVQLGQGRAALACFQALDERMTTFSLESWDPALAAQVLQAHWAALTDAQRVSKEADLARRADEVYRRLCALDVVAGLRAGPGR